MAYTSLRALAAAIAQRACGAAFYGTVRNELYRQVVARAPGLPCKAVDTMHEALFWCWHRSRPGDSIVLSPACASFDQYGSYEERGEHFKQIVARLALTA